MFDDMDVVTKGLIPPVVVPALAEDVPVTAEVVSLEDRRALLRRRRRRGLGWRVLLVSGVVVASLVALGWLLAVTMGLFQAA